MHMLEEFESRNKENLMITAILVAMYLAAIIAANILVAEFGPQVAIFNALLFVGLDLTARDQLHEAWEGRQLWARMLLLIATGSILSWVLNRNAGPIALASFVAFASAGLLDTIIYWMLEEESRILRINGSNIVSAIADSALFIVLAFGWPPLWGILAGQIAAKILGGALWSVVLVKAERLIAVMR